jgi:hypothetical protein
MTAPDAGPPSPAETAAEVRRLLHLGDPASLASAAADPVADLGAAAPYASLVRVAPDWAGRPLLLLSDLAQHTRNAAGDARVCLLLTDPAARTEPLAGSRASVLGRLARADTDALRARYLRYHPEAERYAALADFRLYRLEPAAAHLVGGFGRIAWCEGAGALRGLDGADALIAAEAEIVGHMNEDHLDATRDIAVGLLGAGPAEVGDWRLAGVDPEGADLMRSAGPPARLRLDYAKRAHDAESCRVELVRAVKQARRNAPAAGG